MLSIRLHVVMGHAAASLWCTSHGPEHCLWSGRMWLEADGPHELVQALAHAAVEASARAARGELEELTDECGS